MSSPLVLRNLSIWDGGGAGYREDVDTLVIADGRIRELTSSEDLGERAAARDCSGIAALPGLIDAHVHLELDPETHDLPAKVEGEALEGRAAAMVRAGITTARDLGGGTYQALQLRDRILRGELSGPRLLCAGQPITSVAGHCHFWGGEAADLPAAVAVLERQLDHDVDLIKIMATGGNLTKGTDPSRAQFPVATIAELVQRASAEGLAVAAHCHGTEGIRNACRAGVTTIEHCSWAGPQGFGTLFDDEVAREIGQRGIWVSPTINAGWRRHMGGSAHGTRLRSNYRRLNRSSPVS